MTIRQHLTALPKGSAFPTITDDLPDGYPFLLDGVLYQLDRSGTPTFVLVAGGSTSMVGFYDHLAHWRWSGDPEILGFAASGSSRNIIVPNVAYSLWEDVGIAPSGDSLVLMEPDEFGRFNVWPSGGQYVVTVEFTVSGLQPGDVVEVGLGGTAEGNFGPVQQFVCAPGETVIQGATFQWVSTATARMTSPLRPTMSVYFAAGSVPLLEEVGVGMRMVSLEDDAEAVNRLAPVVTGLAVAAGTAGQAVVSWTGTPGESMRLAVVDAATNTELAQTTLSSGSGHTFTGLTTGTRVFVQASTTQNGAGRTRSGVVASGSAVVA